MEARALVFKLYPTAIGTSIQIALKRSVGTKVKDAAVGAAGVGAGGLAITAGCLLQCVLSAIPVLIGLWILGYLFQSC
jgi:hypothetical protein